MQDPSLKRITSSLPKNAKYTSPEVQNEVIETLAEIVRENVAQECKQAELFTYNLQQIGKQVVASLFKVAELLTFLFGLVARLFETINTFIQPYVLPHAIS